VRVVIFGATGMVGGGALREALEAEEVEAVATVGRRPTGLSHPKLQEIVHDDLLDYTSIRERLSGLDACFFCLGVTSAGMSEAEYRRVTVDLAVAAARALLELNPGMTFCFVSGAGADSSEAGRIMWARVKGAAENGLLAMPFPAVYCLRPAFIQPMRGVRSRTRIYAALYAVTSPLYPLLRRLFPKYVTTSVAVGRAMIRLVGSDHPSGVLENDDINRVGGAAP